MPGHLEPPRRRRPHRLVRNLLRVAAEYWETALEQMRRRAGSEHELRDIRYEVAGREAHRIELGGQSFLQVEPYEQYFSMAWSTRLPVAGVLDRLPLVVSSEGAAIVFDERVGEHVTQPASMITQRILSGESFPFVRFELPRTTIIWDQPPLGTAERRGALGALWSAAGPSRLGLVADVFDPAYCLELLRRTATAPVVRRRYALISRIEYVHEWVPSGRLSVSA